MSRITVFDHLKLRLLQPTERAGLIAAKGSCRLRKRNCTAWSAGNSCPASYGLAKLEPAMMSSVTTRRIVVRVHYYLFILYIFVVLAIPLYSVSYTRL
jgi:hypothetical protein